MLGQRLADGNERRGLGQAVDMDDLPAEFRLHALDRRRRRRRTGGEHAHASPQLPAHRLRAIRDADENRRRRAQMRDALAIDLLVDREWLDLAQAHVAPRRPP